MIPITNLPDLIFLLIGILVIILLFVFWILIHGGQDEKEMKYKITKRKWNLGFSSERFFPMYKPTTYLVEVPIIKKDKLKGEYTSGYIFYDLRDAENFRRFLIKYLPKIIKQYKEYK